MDQNTEDHKLEKELEAFAGRHEVLDRAGRLESNVTDELSTHPAISGLPEDHPVQQALSAAEDAVGELYQVIATWYWAELDAAEARRRGTA